jgi:AcrR family transcriptional regulator
MTRDDALRLEPDEDTRVRILDAAEDIFAAMGYEATTIRAICERAGVRNIGAVNYHFHTKERLYADTVKYALRTCTEGAPFPEWSPGTPAEQKLRDFIRVMMTRMMEAPKASSMQLMMREFTQPSPACVEAVRQNIEPIADKLRAIVSELLPHAPEPKRMLVAFSIVGQCLYYRQNKAVAEILVGADAFAKLNAQVLAEHIAEFTLAALVTTPAGQSGAFEGTRPEHRGST